MSRYLEDAKLDGAVTIQIAASSLSNKIGVKQQLHAHVMGRLHVKLSANIEDDVRELMQQISKTSIKKDEKYYGIVHITRDLEVH